MDFCGGFWGFFWVNFGLILPDFRGDFCANFLAFISIFPFPFFSRFRAVFPRFQAPSPLSSRALDEAGQRHRELQRLERGLRELGELFQLLSGTVEAQGDVIDRIEQQVLHSGAHLEKGRGHLQGAGRRQKAARKKRLALAACASVAILVLVAIVAASVASG
nr:syntaxin-1A [Zonotrichia albicollis]